MSVKVAPGAGKDPGENGKGRQENVAVARSCVDELEDLVLETELGVKAKPVLQQLRISLKELGTGPNADGKGSGENPSSLQTLPTQHSRRHSVHFEAEEIKEKVPTIGGSGGFKEELREEQLTTHIRKRGHLLGMTHVSTGGRRTSIAALAAREAGTVQSSKYLGLATEPRPQKFILLKPISEF